ncbi:MAG: glycosyltransferase family 2 protein, partial [Candidatus Electrothrix sp. MAN1_4]|nr:glycosyltransferase family 2 protein [Candidatus Electrothrix sp. MAN1_4]
MTSISVVIPCYNQGRTIRETLDSVHQQTVPPAEVVIIDDGSEDMYTRQVLAEISASGTGVIRTENRGVAAARNLGIRVTTSPYIVLLDGDDALEPQYLTKASGLLNEQSDVDFVTCGLQAFEGADYTWTPPCTLEETIARGGPHISTMFRRSVWHNAGGFDEELPGYEDMDFWISALRQGCKGTVLDEPLLRYRVRSNSRYHNAISAEKYVPTMAAIYRKHWPRIKGNSQLLIQAKDDFLHEQQQYQSYLSERKSILLIQAKDD